MCENDESKILDLPKPTLVARIIAWNSARYPEVYNDELQVSLIVEEAAEGLAASSEIDCLDSIGDQLFVMIGGFWKAGMLHTPERLAVVEQAIISESVQLLEIVFRQDLWATQRPGVEYSMMAFATCVQALKDFNHARQIKANVRENYRDESISLYSVLEAIVDSNETKEVHKTDSGIKANLSKGSSFVSPSRALERLQKGDSCG